MLGLSPERSVASVFVSLIGTRANQLLPLAHRWFPLSIARIRKTHQLDFKGNFLRDVWDACKVFPSPATDFLSNEIDIQREKVRVIRKDKEKGRTGCDSSSSRVAQNLTIYSESGLFLPLFIEYIYNLLQFLSLHWLLLPLAQLCQFPGIGIRPAPLTVAVTLHSNTIYVFWKKKRKKSNAQGDVMTVMPLPRCNSWSAIHFVFLCCFQNWVGLAAALYLDVTVAPHRLR